MEGYTYSHEMQTKFYKDWFSHSKLMGDGGFRDRQHVIAYAYFHFLLRKAG
jgi:hypothetical protein